MSSFDWLPAAIRQRSTLRQLEAGENLFRQGDKTFGIFEVEHGRLHLIRHTIDDHPVSLHTAKKGPPSTAQSTLDLSKPADATKPETPSA